MDRDHLDPEIVAAWVDGSLDARGRAEAEAHAADCARCQAVLAAMIRTEPAPVAKPWLSATAFRWLVPLTAAAAAVAIWVAVTPKTGQHVPESAASVERAEPKQDSASEMMTDRVAPAPQAAAAPADRQAAAKRERPGTPRAEGEVAAVDSLKPPAAGGAAATAESVTTRTEPPAAPPPPPVAAPLQSTAAPAEARGVVARRMAVSTFAGLREFRTADGALQWRIDPPAHLWRSSDGGKTWTPQTSGVATELTAGSAASATAVWIVGRGGVVLLSTDGENWKKVAFPETVDLTAVTASDARSAVVRAADGRTFRTDDGGATWTNR